MGTLRWLNIWDATQAVTGSVYIVPTYASGPESGTAIYTAPATKYFTAGQGAPARNVNWALQQIGASAVQAAQHQAMRFQVGHNWSSSITIKHACQARSNRGFVVGTASTVSVVREPNNLSRLDIFPPAVGLPYVALDDGTRIWEFENNAGGTARYMAGSSTVSSGTALTGLATPFAARQIGANSMVVGTSGTGLVLFTTSGTAWVSVAKPTGTFNSSTLSLWGSAQAYLGATTATGSAIFYAKGLTSNAAIATSDCSTTANTLALTLPATSDTLADIAYDDVQGLFVACCYSSTSSVLKFFTTPNPPTTWTASATATGPASLVFNAIAGEVAFGICCGVWLVVSTTNQFTHYVSGTSSQYRPCAFYSLDFGQTWYPANLDMNIESDLTTIRIASGVDQFMVYHDGDVAMSGRLGYNETL